MALPYLQDNWSYLNRYIGQATEDVIDLAPNGVPLAQTWVPKPDRRRLAAYTVLNAIGENTFANHVPFLMDADAETNRSQWREYGNPELLTVAGRAAMLGEDQTVSVRPADKARDKLSDFETAAHDWLLQWCDDEKMILRLLDAEHDAMGLGDGVHVLGWNEDKQRAKWRVYDPGLFFPDYESMGPHDDFPRTVHLAWEEEDNDGKKYIRRITWRLLDLDGPTRYRWTPASEEATQTVVYSDGRWPLDVTQARNGLYDLSDGRAQWITPPTDLHIDFIPVIHIPNTSSGKIRWGRPLWWSTIRALEDIQASDTDAQVGSQLFGSGAMIVKGSGVGTVAGPGAQHNVGEGGDAAFLDMSAGMRAMVEYVAGLIDRVSTNVRLVPELLGQVRASDVPSGISIAMAWGPTINLVRELRQIREDKYRMLLKFAMRLAQAANLLPAGELPVPTLNFGSFLPADRTAVLEVVEKAYAAHLISLETALQMLIDGGFPIEDASDELVRIGKQDFERAGLLLDATGSTEAVRTLIRTGKVVIPDTPAPATPTPPAAPTGTLAPPVVVGPDGQPVNPTG